MSFSSLAVLLTLLLSALDQMTGQTLDPHGPPRVDRNPLFLDSFLPAGMQVISHATELMKYEIPTTEVPTSTTPPSTSSHKPGIFAPNPTPSGIGFKNRARSAYLLKNSQFFGKIHADLFNRVNGIDDDYDEILTQDQKVERFLSDYDDSPVTYLRKKKPPPPKAYVTLLSLYDNLNREAKKLGMNKYAGYTSKVLAKLSEFSKGNSANQMREIFSKIVDRKEVRQENTIKTLKVLIDDLKDPKSYLNDALRYIPPLNFNSDV